MGRSCPQYTLWADGFNGTIRTRRSCPSLPPHPPSTSNPAGNSILPGNSFAIDMGYRSATGGWLPGVSVFRRDGDDIVRVADTGFGPDDDFCTLWHLFGLLPEGAAGWHAKFDYR